VSGGSNAIAANAANVHRFHHTMFLGDEFGTAETGAFFLPLTKG
jgi:hypothetical protein